MQKLKHFQVYSDSKTKAINILVDKIWIQNNRIYFRIMENLCPKLQLRQEKELDIYSIDINELFSIRCKLYF
jgi:hypothetical protein